MITAIDLCCGAGGWACAARGLPIRWVAVADLAADCLETWRINHGDAHPDCREVRCDLSTSHGVAMVLDAVKDVRVDLVVGGIPCEQVSQARGNKPLKAGELDTLHALVDNCFAIVKMLRPRWWSFEDVEAIVPHLPVPLDFGLPFEVRKINAADYGPQARTRVFIGSYPPLAPPEPGPRTLGEILRPGPYRTLSDLKKRAALVDVARFGAETIPDANSKAHTVRTGRGREQPVRCPPSIQDRPLDAGEPSNAIVSRTSSMTVRDPFSRERPAVGDEPARSVVAGHGDRSWAIEDGGMVRVLEWQEAALLQGFPPHYVFAASWSRTWKMVAQAIPIQVGRAILSGVVEANQ